MGCDLTHLQSANPLSVLFSDDNIPLDRSPNLSGCNLNFIGTLPSLERISDITWYRHMGHVCITFQAYELFSFGILWVCTCLYNNAFSEHHTTFMVRNRPYVRLLAVFHSILGWTGHCHMHGQRLATSFHCFSSPKEFRKWHLRANTPSCGTLKALFNPLSMKSCDTSSSLILQVLEWCCSDFALATVAATAPNLCNMVEHHIDIWPVTPTRRHDENDSYWATQRKKACPKRCLDPRKAAAHQTDLELQWHRATRKSNFINSFFKVAKLISNLSESPRLHALIA